MTVRYVGQYRSVIVPMPFGGEAEVEHGKTLDTTDEHASLLLVQPANWESVAPPEKPKAEPKAKDEVKG